MFPQRSTFSYESYVHIWTLFCVIVMVLLSSMCLFAADIKHGLAVFFWGGKELGLLAASKPCLATTHTVAIAQISGCYQSYIETPVNRPQIKSLC